MKDSGVRFDVEKARNHMLYRLNNSKADHAVVQIILEMLEAGLVSEETNNSQVTDKFEPNALDLDGNPIQYKINGGYDND